MGLYSLHHPRAKYLQRSYLTVEEALISRSMVLCSDKGQTTRNIVDHIFLMNVCKAFENSWKCESLRRLGISWFNGNNLIDDISICHSLFKCTKITHFLKITITVDEKCIAYNNVVRKMSWGKWTTVNYSRILSAFGDAVYHLGLEKHYVLQSPSAKSYFEFRKLFLDWLKVVIDEIHPKLVNRKSAVCY